MSERLEFRDDYMGFTYNGKHSSELGIVRVSGGSRFNENLLPTIQDKTVQVPGGDGMYYFGSYYTQRPFTVNYAFDSLDEAGIAELKRRFGDKQIHDLIFDETPYKVWSAKVTGTATLKYLPFKEGDTNRLYKGEGSIQFTCYYPFARCYSSRKIDYYEHPAYRIKKENGFKTYQELSSQEEAYITSKINEWWVASNIREYETGLSYVINFGDVPAPFSVYIDSNSDLKSISILNDDEEVVSTISWRDLPKDSGAVILDTKTGLVIGADDENDGQIYNQYFKGDLIAKIPVGMKIKTSQDLTAEVECLYI